MKPLEQTEQTEFKVESGIPYPGDWYERHKSKRYPFKSMEIGQSFPFGKKDRKAISTAAYKFNEGNQLKFSVRRLKDGSYRVWRIHPSKKEANAPKERIKSIGLVSEPKFREFLEKAVEKITQYQGVLPTLTSVKRSLSYWRKSQKWKETFDRIIQELWIDGKIITRRTKVLKDEVKEGKLIPRSIEQEYSEFRKDLALEEENKSDHKMMGRTSHRVPLIVSDITIKPFMEKAVEKLTKDFESLPTISLVKGYMDYYRKNSGWREIFNRVADDLIKERKIRIKHKHIYKKSNSSLVARALKEKCKALKELQKKCDNFESALREEKEYREEIQKGIRSM